MIRGRTMDRQEPMTPISIKIPDRVLEAIERERVLLEERVRGVKFSRTDAILSLLEFALHVMHATEQDS